MSSGLLVIGRQFRRLALLVLVLGLGGCATPPLAPVIGPEVTPQAAVVGAPPMAEQIWGGVIVQVQNFSAHTRLEVVSYPLRHQEPQTGRMTTGRFLLEMPGFLDPMDYRIGRRITARGQVGRTEAGWIGEVAYQFPVLAANAVHLWPDPPRGGYDYPGRVRFGIGIGIGL